MCQNKLLFLIYCIKQVVTMLNLLPSRIKMIFFFIFINKSLLEACKFYHWCNKFCTWTKRLKWIDSGNNNVKIGSHNDNFANKRLVTFYGLKEFLRRRLVIKPFKCSISPSHISVCFSYSYDCKDQTNIIMTNMCFVECF